MGKGTTTANDDSERTRRGEETVGSEFGVAQLSKSRTIKGKRKRYNTAVTAAKRGVLGPQSITLIPSDTQMLTCKKRPQQKLAGKKCHGQASRDELHGVR